MRPERGKASVVVPPLCEINGTSTKVYNSCAAKKATLSPLLQAEDLRQLSPRNLFDLMRLLSSFELLNDRWQRVPCPKIRSNEINFLPRPGHTRVPKIRKLIKSREGETLCMLKYASVRFRDKQIRVAYKLGPSGSPSSVEWWFTDLAD
jgi:hypothetical protein